MSSQLLRRLKFVERKRLTRQESRLMTQRDAYRCGRSRCFFARDSNTRPWSRSRRRQDSHEAPSTRTLGQRRSGPGCDRQAPERACQCAEDVPAHLGPGRAAGCSSGTGSRNNGGKGIGSLCVSNSTGAPQRNPALEGRLAELCRQEIQTCAGPVAQSFLQTAAFRS